MVHLSQLRGDGQFFSTLATKSWAAAAVVALFNGMSQVIFVQNPVAGLFICAAAFVNSPYTAAAAVLGTIASTLMAVLLGFVRAEVAAGLYGYNGFLAGAAVAVFQRKLDDSWNFVLIIPVVVLSALTSIITRVLATAFTSCVTHTHFTNEDSHETSTLLSRLRKSDFGNRATSPRPDAATRRPITIGAFTFPFHLVVWMWLLVGHTAIYFPNGQASVLTPDLIEIPTNVCRSLMDDYTIDKLAQASVTGVAQVFFFSEFWSGIIILVGCALASVQATLLLYSGSVVGLTVALGLGVDRGSIYAGLWGFDAALAMMCIYACAPYAPHTRWIVKLSCASLAAATASLLHGALSNALVVLGIPALTFPAATACLLFSMSAPHIRRVTHTRQVTPLPVTNGNVLSNDDDVFVTRVVQVETVPT